MTAVEDLARENERLREVLRVLAYPFEYGEPDWGKPRDIPIDCCVSITYADVLAARALLGETEAHADTDEHE